MNGYFGVGICFPQHDCNVGGLFRSAAAFGASFVFTIGRKYRKEASDTPNTTELIPYYHYQTVDEFLANIPKNCIPVNIEITDTARPINSFLHPRNACYILGNEGNGVPKKLLDKFQSVVIPTEICLNVATTGSIVLFHRSISDTYKSRVDYAKRIEGVCYA